MKKSDLEAAFDFQLRVGGPDLPRPESHFQFHPERKWRIDRAWPGHKLAVEIEGGTKPRSIRCHNCGQVVRATKGDGSPGRALRIPGYHQTDRFGTDIEKYNALSALGWTLFRFGHDNIHNDPTSMIEQIRTALDKRAGRFAMIDALTARQKDVLLLVAAGFKTPEIASRLRIKTTAVRKDTQVICEKLVVNNRTSAVSRAIAWGLISVDEIPWTEPANHLLQCQ